jgi:hypothetical protein
MNKTIAITEETARIVAERSAEAGVSEAELIAKWADASEQRRAKIEDLQRRVTEGIDSGPSQRSPDELRDAARARAGVGRQS